jgi:hypothetical protein
MFFWRRRPRIHYYAPAWNEELMLPFLFRHYAPWVERFVIYDSDSTDGSVELLRRTPNVEIRKVPWTQPDSMIATLQALHNTCWKESRGSADWVIVADVDEFLYHPDFLGYLRRCRKRGVTCIPALGYDMVSDRFPGPDEVLLKTVRRGVRSRMMCKLRLFDPNAVEETNFGPGGHVASPTGRIVYPKRDRMLLLHYKSLGADYLIRRSAMMETTRRARDIANNWSHHYRRPDAELIAGVKHGLAASVDVIAAGEGAWRDYRNGRWWRRRKTPATEPR